MKNFPILVLSLSVVFVYAAAEVKATARLLPSSVAATAYSTDDFNQLLADSARLYRERKFDEAFEACEKAAKLRPEDYRPYALCGAANIGRWKMEDASTLLARAIKLNPSSHLLYYSKAYADRFRNARDEGLVAVRKAIELKPDFAEAYLLMGNLLGIGSKNKAEQIAALRRAIELKPDLLEAYSSLGMMLSVSGDTNGAEETYRKALEIDPKKEAGFFDLGRLLVKQNRVKEARELWEKRPPAAKDNTFPNFITLLERAEKMEAAKLAYERAPNDPETILQMGMMTMDGESWVVDGRQEKAIVFFKKALEIKPEFAKAQHAICMAYVQWADTYKSKNKELDEELAKLRKMDAKLADDIDRYRRTYSGGIKGVALPAPKKQ